MSENKDFTDFCLLFFNTGRQKEFVSAFNDLVKEAKSVEDAYPEWFDTEDKLQKEHDEYQEVSFYDSIEKKYIDKPICFSAIVRGEAAKPYIYPTKVKATCDLTRGDKCQTCGLFLTGGKIQLNLDNVNPLELIDITQDQKNKIIKSKVGIIQCAQFELEVIDQKYIQELFLSPNSKSGDENKEQRFFVRHAFYEGSDIIPNKSYKFYSIPTSSPKNQTLVYYIKKAEEQESDLDKFKLKNPNDLKVFQPEEPYKDGIKKKLKEIYDDFSINLSPRIRFRNDIMLAGDLSFHSCLHFKFGGSFEKGWVECLVVGDTSVGKTSVIQKLISHYDLGVIQGAENSTIAGLIGGMTKFETVNIMTWGLLPLNNSRLVVLDEMSGIDKNVFGELTRIRSEGIAERTIVGGSSSTSAKVRLIWLSNPRNRAMNLYDSGCDIVRELVGKQEDISRFDFILTVSEDEVPAKDINTMRSSGKSWIVKHKYKNDLCNSLVLWAWSRKANNIIFEDEVEDLILNYSIEMSKKYSSSFPLVLGSTIRLKLARLSIALAARLFSTDDSCENIIVTQHHVAFIYDWLNKIYNKPSFAYGEYSDYRNLDDEDIDSEKNIALKAINNYVIDIKKFAVNMLTNPRITALEIRDFSQATKDNADYLRTTLVSSGMLIKKAGFYVKSDKFRRILKDEIKKQPKS